MKNHSRYLLFILFWLIPALACSGGPLALVKPTATLTATPTVTPTRKATPTNPPTATDRPTPTNSPTPANTSTAINTATPKPTGTPSPTPGPLTATQTVSSTGKFGPVTFSVGVLNDETPIDPLSTFPNGVTLVYAIFGYSGMTDGEPYRVEWKLDGQAQPKLLHASQWKGGASGNWWVSIYSDTGIRTGKWELDLYLGDTLQQSGTFTVTPNPAGKPDFGPITFAPDKSAQDKPLNALSASNPILPKGTTTVYAFFDGINVPSGTTWTSHWFFNGKSAAVPKNHTWQFGPNDNDWISFGTTDKTPLASGTYELQLSIGSNVVNVATYIMP